MPRVQTVHTASPRLLATATAARRRHSSFDRVAVVAGTSSLSLIAVVGASILLATFNGYAGGVVLGGGTAGLIAAIARVRRRWSERKPTARGRSHTQDCRQARWDRQEERYVGAPPPRPMVRRVVDCRNTRHSGR